MLGKIKRIYAWLLLGRGHKGLVLDVGSGNSPHPRADVLCDQFPEHTRHRHGARLVRDRTFVCADICALPFHTGTYDFVVARHVLEHLEPTQIPSAVAELSRVARAGYIETPSPVCEMLMPDPEHRSFVEVRAGVLTFTPKQQVFPFPPIARALLEWRKKSQAWERFIENNSSLFVTTLRWENRIDCEIEPPRLYPALFDTTVDDLCMISDIAVAQGFASSQARHWAKIVLRFTYGAARKLRKRSHSGASTRAPRPGRNAGRS